MTCYLAFNLHIIKATGKGVVVVETYRVKVNAHGEIVLPSELRDLLGLVTDDTVELIIDPQGKIALCTAERSVGPLADFFEDLILSDLHGEGYSGDVLKGKFLECKIQLSTVLDRLAEEAHRFCSKRHTLSWRETVELRFVSLTRDQRQEYQVILTPRTERDLRKLPENVLKRIPGVFGDLEQDPLAFKRLRGPYYETFRVSLSGEGMEHYRVIYTVFPTEGIVTILSIGERKMIYEHLKGLA